VNIHPTPQDQSGSRARCFTIRACFTRPVHVHVLVLARCSARSVAHALVPIFSDKPCGPHFGSEST